MVEFLFLDLDDTILDFGKAERIALRKTLEEMGLTVDEQLLARYHVINLEHWQRLERGELTREQVVVQRFAVLFAEYGALADPEICARRYAENLSIGHYFLPGALEAVQRLHKRCRLFLASNGTASVQHSRLTSAGLYPYFEQVFISQHVGVNKPDREFFTRSFAKIPGFDPERAMMVGDSLTSDILGGIHAGIRTCWVNLHGAPEPQDIRPDHTITSITQLEALLETL